MYAWAVIENPCSKPIKGHQIVIDAVILLRVAFEQTWVESTLDSYVAFT